MPRATSKTQVATSENKTKKKSKKMKRRFPGGIPNIIPVKDVNNFKVLGLDGAFVVSGWSVMDQDEQLLDCGTITQHQYKKTNPGVDFLIYYFNELKQIIEKWHPDIMIIEDAYGGLNISTLKKLTKMHGVSELCARMLEVPFVYYCFPSESRFMVFKRGDILKPEIYDIFCEKYGDVIFNKTLDISDSMVLAICGIKLAKADFMFPIEKEEG